MTPIKLNNGEGMHLIEVPEDANDFFEDGGDTPLTSKPNEKHLGVRTASGGGITIGLGIETDFKILGTYHKGEIDFEVKEGWAKTVKYNSGNDYFDYQQQRFLITFTAKDSFLSLLQSLTSPDKKYAVLIEIKK